MDYILYLVAVAGVILYFHIKNIKKEIHGYFRYLWEETQCFQIRDWCKDKHGESYYADIEVEFSRACSRIHSQKTNISIQVRQILEETEFSFRTKRSLDALLNKAKKVEQVLAEFCGYEQREVQNRNFNCLGKEELWEIYSFHKDRILGKNKFKHYRFKTKDHSHSHKTIGPDAYHTIFQEITSLDALDAKYSSIKAKNHDNPNVLPILEKLYIEARQRILNTGHHEEPKNGFDSRRSASTKNNENLFINIRNLNDLKKKFHKLAKLNHPDSGGSHAAMKKLNELYNIARERIENNRK